jgi:hypothetical protein
MKSISRKTITQLIIGLTVSLAALVAFVTLYFSYGFGWFSVNKKVTADGVGFGVTEMQSGNKITELLVNGAKAEGEYNILPGEYYYFQLTLEGDLTECEISLTVKELTFPSATDIDVNLTGGEQIKERAASGTLPSCANALKVAFFSTDKGESSCKQAWATAEIISFEEDDGEWTAGAQSQVVDNKVYAILYFDPDVSWDAAADNSNGFYGQKFTLGFFVGETQEEQEQA